MDELLTVNDVCELFKISRRTLERWRKKGLPSTKVGALVRFKRNDIEQWLTEHVEQKGDMNTLDGHKIVIGRIGTGKSTKEIIPAIKNWDGPVLAFDSKGQLLSNTKEDRTKKGAVISICLNDENIEKQVLDLLKDGSTVYLTLDHSKNELDRFSESLNLILNSLLNNQTTSPLLIVLDDFEALSKLDSLPELLRRGRKQNIYIIISMLVANIYDAIFHLKRLGYNEYDASIIVNNCHIVDVTNKPVPHDTFPEIKDVASSNLSIEDLFQNFNPASGMTMASFHQQISTVLNLISQGKEIYVCDPKGEYKKISDISIKNKSDEDKQDSN